MGQPCGSSALPKREPALCEQQTVYIHFQAPQRAKFTMESVVKELLINSDLLGIVKKSMIDRHNY